MLLLLKVKMLRKINYSQRKLSLPKMITAYAKGGECNKIPNASPTLVVTANSIFTGENTRISNVILTLVANSEKLIKIVSSLIRLEIVYVCI